MDPEAEYLTDPIDHLIEEKKIASKLSIGIFCIISASVNQTYVKSFKKIYFCLLQVVWGQLDHSFDEEVDEGQSVSSVYNFYLDSRNYYLGDLFENRTGL